MTRFERSRFSILHMHSLAWFLQITSLKEATDRFQTFDKNPRTTGQPHR